ncbi:MAG TPA: DUF3099 domain-containing protein [Pseudonocardiaceae bacterium]
MKDRARAGTPESPVLITAAPPSLAEQHAARRRKYAIMMSMRIPLLIAAAACYRIWWLALILILISIPLPWAAVLIANDRPPRKREKVNRFRPEARAVERREHQVIEERTD